MSRSAVRCLMVQEIRRTWLAYVRSFAPAVIFFLLAAAQPAAKGSLLLLVGIVSMALLGAFAVPMQVSRDRASGVLAYFGTLPISGRDLFAARMGVSIMFVVVTLVMVGAVVWITPESHLGIVVAARTPSALPGAFILLTWFSAVTIGLNARFSATTTIMVPIFLAILIDKIWGLLGLSKVFAPIIAIASEGASGRLAILGTFGLFVLVALAGFAIWIGTKAMQPHGAPLSDDALEQLRGRQPHHGNV